MRASRLLVLDATASANATLVDVAETHGYETLVTTEVEAFMDLLGSWRPEVVAVDLELHETDGIEVIRRLAALPFEGTVILTSGLEARVLEAARQSALAHGLTVDCLSRPFDPAAVRDALGAADGDRAIRSAADEPGRQRQGVAVSAADLGQALGLGDLHVVYQPKFDCDTGVVMAVEALARWHDARFGEVGPDVFIPIAEAHGLIDRLTDFVIREALGWFGAHFGGTSLRLCLNLSARSLDDIALADHLEQLCRDASVDPAQVVLELTETSSIGDQEAARDLLTRLRIKGMSLAIDDFGSGHSSLVQLARQPFSELKIDQAFVRTVAASSDSRTIVQAIIGLARSLAMQVTAEGIEDQASHDALAAMGCDLMQGNFLAPPMPGEETLEWIDGRLPVLRTVQRGG
jgi:EAL domain-containing protein (putative c-di-GMP-specific phosphodiesterase class I)/FixJ family two-component response regulator